MTIKMKTSPSTPAERLCPACGGSMIRETRADTILYKGVSADVSQPGWWCQDCAEAVLDPADQEAADQAYKDLRAGVDGILLPEQVRAIRKRLGLSQRKAGEVLGGGPRAFQKYERGVVAVSRPMSNLLRLLDADPEAVGHLTARGDSAPRTGTVEEKSAMTPEPG